jgi:hypothetical protein
MEVGQGPNWGCSAKEKKNMQAVSADINFFALRGIDVRHICPIPYMN